MTQFTRLHKAAALALLVPSSAFAHDGGIIADRGNAFAAADIVHAKLSVAGDHLVFHMAVAGEAGTKKPDAVGTLAGAGVFAYVWPTSLDSSVVGFAPGAGILALAVTAHPDFDDTPRDDENGDGDLANDGNEWHSHWVVLGGDDACGPGALKVIDIPEGSDPVVPDTWPNLPLLIDSPGYVPAFDADSVDVRVPVAQIGEIGEVHYDGVVSGLRLNANLHAPLLCVTEVHDIASGDLSLPGVVER